MSAQGKWKISDTSDHIVATVAEGYLRAECPTPEIARAIVAAHNVQCEAEPVGWQFKAVANDWWSDCNERTARTMQERPELWDVRALYTAPPPPASAVALIERVAEQHGTKPYLADEIIRVLKEAGL